jgi:hypothetical protein
VAAVLAPQTAANYPGYFFGNAPNASSANPALSFAGFGTSQVTLGRNTSTSGYNAINGTQVIATDGKHVLGGNVSSYGEVILDGSRSYPVSVGGNVNVPEQNGPGALSAQTQSRSSSESAINGYLNVNGRQQGFSSGSNGNVLGLNTGTASQSTPIVINAGNSQPNLPAAPEPPPSFKDSGSASNLEPVSLGDISLQSGSTIRVSSTAPPPPYTILSSGTVSIQPGNYTAGSLTMTGTSQIVVLSNVTSSQPFRIYVNDQNDSNGVTDAISLTNSTGITNSTGVPSNVQIYYNGAKPINLAQTSGNFSSLLYAPNAPVSIGTTPSTAQIPYYGSYVGSSLTVENAFLHFDQSINPASSPNSGFATELGVAYSSFSGTKGAVPALKVVYWQEL